MTKLIVLSILIPIYLKFHYRKSPRIRARVFPWYFTVAAVLLLLIFPWDASPGAYTRIVGGVRLTIAALLLAFLVLDIRRTTRR